MKKRILFLHTNFPAQYRRLAPFLASTGDYDIRVGTLDSNKQPIIYPHVKFRKHREPRPDTHPGLIRTENAVLVGQAAYVALQVFKKKDWKPDIVCAHSGYGIGLFVKEVFPDARYLAYHEWYFNRTLDELGRPLDEEDPNTAIRRRLDNIPFLLDLSSMDAGITPTHWQHSQFPEVFKDRIKVLHDGFDTDFFCPGKMDSITLPSGKILNNNGKIITYVARGMEPYRGFPQFMEAISKIQKRDPDIHAIIVGKDRVAYGKKRTDGLSYKEYALSNLEIDPARTHFTGLVSYETLRDLFRLSSCHVYLTVPFVLSWSVLEAMATGCVVLGSDTPPIQEVIKDGENGFLVDMTNVDEIASRIEYIVNNKDSFSNIRRNATKTIIDNYNHVDCLNAHKKIIDEI